jgi:hypothetical protein
MDRQKYLKGEKIVKPIVKEKKKFLYKIQRAEGLFSKGGENPDFTKVGKTWTNIGHVKTHLKGVRNSEYGRAIPEDWKIIEIPIEPKIYNSYSAREFMEESKREAVRKEERVAERRAKQKENEEYKLFKELQKKFDE